MKRVVAVSVVVLSILATSASAERGARPSVTPKPPVQPAGGKSPESFDGECYLTATVTFDPPMTNTPQHVRQVADVPSKCTGTFVDAHGRSHELDNADVHFMSVAEGDNVSCGSSMPIGYGRAEFPEGTIDYAFSEYRIGATPLIELTGAASGSMLAQVAPSPGGDPVDLVAKCAGEGLAEAHVEGRAWTTPEISG